MKVNYQLEMENVIAQLGEEKPTLLLHSCCGPCSSAVIERLSAHFRVTVFYYNPNIEPEEEYLHRLSEQKRLLGILQIPLLECEWDHDAFACFAEQMKDEPEGGARCTACFALRLNKTAQLAKQHGFDYFTTTLSVSPHKDPIRLNELGEKYALQYDVKHLPADFKKKNGYLRSLQLSKEYDLYRQDYCGCLYSKADT
ncbi:MAG: epoxyqueuosine reductase QueH [Clostridia bacterium]|nr:epoxyqueuosine reductase QueH [Clostridia bacterium]